MAQSPRPLMSFVMVARNDDFHGDYRYRLSMCLDFLCKGLAETGHTRDTEIIVCDWGSEVPLHEELELHPSAREQVKFLVVPRALALERQVRGSTFAYPIGLNAAVRRAAGEYICELTADIVMTAASIDMLMAIFAGKYPEVPVREAFFPLLRRQLPMCQTKRRPSLRELQEYLTRNMTLLPVDNMGCGYGWAAGEVMHRDIWRELRGMDETMVYWGWADIDIALRLTQRYPIIDLGNFGVCGIHLQHYFQLPNDPVFLARKNNPPNDTPQYVVNGEDWGLGEQELPVCSLKRVREEESPDATSLAGTVEEWDLSAAQIIEQLTKPALHQQARAVVQAARFDADEFLAPPAEYNAYAALLWHAQRRAARTYVETGMKILYAACVVTRVSPGAELYIVPKWTPAQRDGGSYLLVSNNLLKGLGQHWGYLRFVGEDPATAVERIGKSVAGRFAVDLALVRAGTALPAAPRQALDVASRLTPGGAMVVVGEDEASFQAVWSALAAERPALTYLRFADRVTGVALAATLS